MTKPEAAAFLACCGSTDGSHLLACPTAHATCNHGEGRCVQDAAAPLACPEHDPHPQRDGTEWCPNCPTGLGASDGTSKSQAAPLAQGRPAYNDAAGWLDHLHDALDGTLGAEMKALADDAMQDVLSGRLNGTWQDWRARVLPPVAPAKPLSKPEDYYEPDPFADDDAQAEASTNEP